MIPSQDPKLIAQEVHGEFQVVDIRDLITTKIDHKHNLTR